MVLMCVCLGVLKPLQEVRNEKCNTFFGIGLVSVAAHLLYDHPLQSKTLLIRHTTIVQIWGEMLLLQYKNNYIF